jgi:hypothetical protein
LAYIDEVRKEWRKIKGTSSETDPMSAFMMEIVKFWVA